jgi:hypothetical protein
LLAFFARVDTIISASQAKSPQNRHSALQTSPFTESLADTQIPYLTTHFCWNSMLFLVDFAMMNDKQYEPKMTLCLARDQLTC